MLCNIFKPSARAPTLFSHGLHATEMASPGGPWRSSWGACGFLSVFKGSSGVRGFCGLRGGPRCVRRRPRRVPGGLAPPHPPKTFLKNVLGRLSGCPPQNIKTKNSIKMPLGHCLTSQNRFPYPKRSQRSRRRSHRDVWERLG